MTELVTIVVPIYNAEKTLHSCLKSIVNQTYHHLEIILVNDGSTDHSLHICEQFVSKDRRIKIINQKNKGPSHARNTGIKHATGTYIQFVDADDLIITSMTETLLNCMNQMIDFVLCGYYVKSNRTVKTILPAIKGFFTLKELSQHIGKLYANHLLQSPCNKLYSSKIIKTNDITFPANINLGEDLLFNLDYLNVCQTAFIYQKPLYVYYHYDDSLSKQIHNEYLNHQQMLINQVEQFLHNHNAYSSENRQSLHDVLSQTIINSLSQLFIRYNGDKEKIIQAIDNLFINKQIKNHLPYFIGSSQALLMKTFIYFRLTRTTYFFLKIKHILHRRASRLYHIFKKMNDYSKRYNIKERT